MKKKVLVFILVEILDIITTVIGLLKGLGEHNLLAQNFGNLLICKLVVIIFVAIILQIKKDSKIDWYVPIVAGSVVPWNILIILVSYI